MKVRTRHITSKAIYAGLALTLVMGLAPLAPSVAYADDLDGSLILLGTGVMDDEDEQTADPQAPTAEDLQTQLAIAESTLSAMYDELEQAQATLSKLTYEIEQNTARIEELKTRIEQNNASLERMQSELAEQISQSYKAGKPSLLEFILGSDSIEELTSHIFYQNKIAQRLSAEIANVREAQRRLDNEKVEHETLKVEQERQRSSEEQKSKALEEAAIQQKAYIDQLNDEIKVALESERLKKAEESLAEAQQALLNATNELEREAATQARDEAQAEVDAATQARDEARTNAQGAHTTVQSLVPTVHVPSTATIDQRSTAVNAALSQLGTPYVFGSEQPGVGFDCNGLAHWSWGQAGVEIPYPSGRTMYGQFQWMRASGRWVTDEADLLPGDLVFYSKDGGETIYHVALYVGGGLIVHAAGYQWGVLASPLSFCTGFCGGGSPL